jgi:hypothetical protein
MPKNNILAPELIKALEKAWCYETCADTFKNQYSNRHPSYGNCFVSSLIIWADNNYKDKFVPCYIFEPDQEDNPIWHIFLERTHQDKMVHIDITRKQFMPGYKLKTLKKQSTEHDEFIYKSLFETEERKSITLRLSILLERLRTLGGYNTPYSAEEIIEKISSEYDYILSSQINKIGQ